VLLDTVLITALAAADDAAATDAAVAAARLHVCHDRSLAQRTCHRLLDSIAWRTVRATAIHLL
jgi:hypothetical protein